MSETCYKINVVSFNSASNGGEANRSACTQSSPQTNTNLLVDDVVEGVAVDEQVLHRVAQVLGGVVGDVDDDRVVGFVLRDCPRS